MVLIKNTLFKDRLIQSIGVSLMEENLSLKSFVILMKASKTVEEKIKQDIRSYGMRISDFTVLEALYHKGKLTVREITEAVLINTGSITYVIDKLVKKELVERRHSNEDRDRKSVVKARGGDGEETRGT